MRTILGLSAILILSAGCGSDTETPPSHDASLTCSASNCLGCCQAGSCVDPPTSLSCGTFGNACVVCAATEECTMGTCQPKAATCNNCSGCCKNGLCYPGNLDTACGTGGGPCQDCSTEGKSCSSTSFSCESKPACSNCSGCCKGTQCLSGITDVACGKGGIACTDCSASGSTCDAATSVCTAAPSCTDCSGCCKGNQCLAGTSDSSCGAGGGACVDCSASSQVCGSSGSCEAKPSCNSSNCTGCCAGSSCEPGSSKSACGTGGTQCKSCPQSYQLCSSGVCVVDPDSKWQVIAVSATISQSKVWDPWLPAAYEPPDPYFGIDTNSCSISGLDGCGPSVNNTFTPSWNGAVKSVGLITLDFKASELKKGWCAFVGDADGTGACIVPFETIGLCTVSVSDQELVQGSKTIGSCPNPNDGVNYVSSLKLQFKHVP